MCELLQFLSVIFKNLAAVLCFQKKRFCRVGLLPGGFDVSLRQEGYKDAGFL